ncbi:MAG: hypothetical protein IJ551_09010 [Prevotella sp.]|nr:hypothetical protein [Prevotella sp.]
MKKLQYSIIFGMLRPEINEQISLGLVIIDGDEVTVRYSEEKLKAMRGLFSDVKCDYVGKVIRSMARNKTITSPSQIDYLTRYSNNLIGFSKLQTIDLAPTKNSKDWLYKHYVYGG